MNHSLPEVKEVLIFAPHPDDEALGCAGTIMLLNKKGVSSTIVFLTNGEKLYQEPSPVVAEQRKDEGRRASEMLGCKEPLFLNIPDGEINRHIEKIYNEIYAIIKKREPGIIFSPSPIDYHVDHISTSHIALKLFNTINTFKLTFYEIYSTLRFNYLIDITEVVEDKKRIILNYKASLYGKPEVYVNAALGLNAQRSLFVQKNGYYEAFYMIENNVDLDRICDYLLYRDLYE